MSHAINEPLDLQPATVSLRTSRPDWLTTRLATRNLDMSGYGPGGNQIYTKPTPPQRGSFPLDHDGECKDVMTKYLRCIKKVKGVNESECRELAKAYLSCRMDRNLMARDDFKNLGFQSRTENA